MPGTEKLSCAGREPAAARGSRGGPGHRREAAPGRARSGPRSARPPPLCLRLVTRARRRVAAARARNARAGAAWTITSRTVSPPWWSAHAPPHSRPPLGPRDPPRKTSESLQRASRPRPGASQALPSPPPASSAQLTAKAAARGRPQITGPRLLPYRACLRIFRYPSRCRTRRSPSAAAAAAVFRLRHWMERADGNTEHAPGAPGPAPAAVLRRLAH